MKKITKKAVSLAVTVLLILSAFTVISSAVNGQEISSADESPTFVAVASEQVTNLVEQIREEDAAKAAQGTWSLANAALAVLIASLAAIVVALKGSSGETKIAAAAIAAAAAGIVLFGSDLGGVMVTADRWTFAMSIGAICESLILVDAGKAVSKA